MVKCFVIYICLCKVPKFGFVDLNFKIWIYKREVLILIFFSTFVVGLKN